MNDPGDEVEVLSSGTEPGADRWHAAASRLLGSLTVGPPVDLDPELELLLRRSIRAHARRWHRQLGPRALGIDPEDIVQKVFLQLFEHPPDREESGYPLRRLLAWVRRVTHNYLSGLTTRRSERLGSPGSEDAEVENAWAGSEGRFAARQALLRLRPAVEQEYPSALGLLDLLLDCPHATSQELAQRLHTSAANVDQMRCRLRRVLRRRLADFQDPKWSKR